MVNPLVKLAQEKSVARWTDCPGMAIAVDWEKSNQTKNKGLSMWDKYQNFMTCLSILVTSIKADEDKATQNKASNQDLHVSSGK